jgi:hypothetical protein
VDLRESPCQVSDLALSNQSAIGFLSSVKLTIFAPATSLAMLPSSHWRCGHLEITPAALALPHIKASASLVFHSGPWWALWAVHDLLGLRTL